MNTTTDQAITLPLLQRFDHPTHAILKNVLWIAHYRGDGTASGDRKLKAMVGEKAYETIHWDTLVSNGSVALFIPRSRVEGGVEAPTGFCVGRAQHLWALMEIDERSPEVTAARPDVVTRYAPEDSVLLAILPGFEPVEVRNVNFYRDNVKATQPAPKDVLYFRFAGGYGMAMPRKGGAS